MTAKPICFSYIQRGSSPLALVLYIFFFSFFVILFSCPLGLHASPIKRAHTPSCSTPVAGSGSWLGTSALTRPGWAGRLRGVPVPVPGAGLVGPSELKGTQAAEGQPARSHRPVPSLSHIRTPAHLLPCPQPTPSRPLPGHPAPLTSSPAAPYALLAHLPRRPPM